MRAKDAARLSTIRLLLAAIKQREVDERIELTDAETMDVETVGELWELVERKRAARGLPDEARGNPR